MTFLLFLASVRFTSAYFTVDFKTNNCFLCAFLLFDLTNYKVKKLTRHNTKKENRQGKLAVTYPNVIPIGATRDARAAVLSSTSPNMFAF